jgi:hypothetical protein
MRSEGFLCALPRFRFSNEAGKLAGVVPGPLGFRNISHSFPSVPSRAVEPPFGAFSHFGSSNVFTMSELFFRKCCVLEAIF